MKLLWWLVGVVLLPVCVAATQTLVGLIVAVRPESTALVPAPFLFLAGGYLLWLLVYFTLPRPVRAYVLAHELTHALWGAVMGARVMGMSVSRHRGSVTLSKTNVLITLAPYFFPLYTALAVAAYYLLGIFHDVQRYQLVWLAVVGFTWGFHFTFTISSLMQHQTDIQLYGRLFSYAVIYLMNVLGLCLWVVLMASPTLGTLLDYLGFNLREAWAWSWRLLSSGIDQARNISGVLGVK